jgi:hypothetical protein
MSVIVNTFWIAGNILFNTTTGQTSQVLMLVNRATDATIFSEADVNTYLAFIRARSSHITWATEHRPEGWVIRGTQVQNTLG